MAAISKVIRYGRYNHAFPAVWNDVEAYVFTNGVWHSYEPFEMWNNAGLLSKTDYDAAFPGLPALPKGSFADAVSARDQGSV